MKLTEFVLPHLHCPTPSLLWILPRQPWQREGRIIRIKDYLTSTVKDIAVINLVIEGALLIVQNKHVC